MVLGLPLSFLATTVSGWFWVALLLLMGVIGFIGMRLRCHVCGKPVTYNPVNLLFLIEMWMWTPWIPEHCTKCGAKIE
jgi:hypothetical protein